MTKTNGTKVTVRELYNLVDNRFDKLDSRINKSLERVDNCEHDITELKTKQSLMAYAQITLSIVASSIAAFLGVRS